MKCVYLWVSMLLALAGALHVGLLTPFMYDRLDHEAVWFLSGGMLALTAGAANLALAPAASPRRTMAIAALVGAIGVLGMATALTQASIYLIGSPLVIACLVLSTTASLFALRALIRG
ncbi:MAG: hypothetical protein U5J99_02375 [Parvularculaceae bacterium]|nr:hypothetical protein [Parvularculaceae bacterium]